MNSNYLIEQLIVDASNDPLNPSKNLEIALEYERLGQTASAVSFYLRAAEYGVDSDKNIAYASLLRVSICIEGQKDRNATVSNVLLQALAYLPKRPEAYLLMSKFYEKSSSWQEAYTFAELGLSCTTVDSELPISVGYPGVYSLEFQKAVAAWWIGRKDESLEIFSKLENLDGIEEGYKSAIDYNLGRIR